MLVSVLKHCKKILKPGGILAFSLKAGQGEEISYQKLPGPRYFRYYEEKEVRDILADTALEVVEVTTGDGGKWIRVLVRSGMVK